MERYGNLEAVKLEVPEFKQLPISFKRTAHQLVMAGLWGRDIIYDQNCVYNLDIRKILEEIYIAAPDTTEENSKKFTDYLCNFWANNGLHNGRSGSKLVPEFDQEWFLEVVKDNSPYYDRLLKTKGEEYISTLMTAIFDPEFLAIQTSPNLDIAANNLYAGVTTEEAREFYKGCEESAINSRLVKDSSGRLVEETYKVGGKYGKYLEQIVTCINSAKQNAERELHESLIALSKSFNSGEFKDIYDFNVAWAKSHPSTVDFINGFTEVYLDGLGMKGTFESIVELLNARTDDVWKANKLKAIASIYNQRTPVPKEFKNEKISDTATNKNIVVLAFGGDSYPKGLSGVNLPNDPEIRAKVGSKSATLVNIIESRQQAFNDKDREKLLLRFYTKSQLSRRKKYFVDAWKLFVSMHELLGHGSGKLLEGVTTTSLREHHSTIEEARADVCALYHIADKITVTEDLLPNTVAYKTIYDDYLISGLFTQLNTLSEDCIEIKEAHARNRMLISRFVFEHASKIKGVLEITYPDGSSVPHIVIKKYGVVRKIIAQLLTILQTITSTGDYRAADDFVKEYVVLDTDVLKEIKAIFREFDLPNETAYINPKFTVKQNGDITCETSENFIVQNLRYSREYSFVK